MLYSVVQSSKIWYSVVTLVQCGAVGSRFVQCVISCNLVWYIVVLCGYWVSMRMNVVLGGIVWWSFVQFVAV